MPTWSTKHPVPTGQSVLITGCSSGIGRATAIHLAQHGFAVFATVRKEADAESLRSLNAPNLIPVCQLDLTRLEQIYRIGAFLGVGVVALLASFLYQRFFATAKNEPEIKNETDR